MTDIRETLTLCTAAVTRIEDVLDVLPVFENMINDVPMKLEDIQYEIADFWETAFCLKMDETTDPVVVLKIAARLNDLPIAHSIQFVKRIADHVLRSSLANKNHDIMMMVLATCGWYIRDYETKIILTILRDRTDWKLRRVSWARASAQTTRLENLLEETKWKIPPNMTVTLSVDGIRAEERTAAFSVTVISIKEIDKETTSHLPLEVCMSQIGLEFKSTALGKNWIAYSDGRGGADVYDCGEWKYFRRPMKDDNIVDKFFDSRYERKREITENGQSYESIRNACEEHLKTIVDGFTSV